MIIWHVAILNLLTLCTFMMIQYWRQTRGEKIPSQSMCWPEAITTYGQWKLAGAASENLLMLLHLACHESAIYWTVWTAGVIYYCLLSEVERELGKLFSKGGGSGVGTKSKYSGSKFNMVVEDIREGVLVSTLLAWDEFFRACSS